MYQHYYDDDERQSGYGGALIFGIFLFLILWEVWVVLRFGFRLGRAALRITPWPNFNGFIASFLSITMACSTCITASLVWVMVPSLNIFHWPDRVATNIFAGWALVNVFMVLPLMLIYWVTRFGAWLFRKEIETTQVSRNAVGYYRS